MEMLVPATVKQARWYLVGGILAVIVGVIRAIGFANYGGVVYLVMAALFLALGAASIAAGVIRITRGDDGDSAGPAQDRR
jgi:hypothetical protein